MKRRMKLLGSKLQSLGIMLSFPLATVVAAVVNDDEEMLGLKVGEVDANRPAGHCSPFLSADAGGYKLDTSTLVV